MLTQSNLVDCYQNDIVGYVEEIKTPKKVLTHLPIEPYIDYSNYDGLGPFLVKSNEYRHYLTLKERFLCWLGLENAKSLNKKHLTI